MPKVLQDYLGYRIYFYSREHVPIHVHCQNGDKYVRIRVDDNVSEYPGPANKTTAPKQDVAKLIKYIEENKQVVREKWNIYFKTCDS
jgi:hypothetical protein